MKLPIVLVYFFQCEEIVFRQGILRLTIYHCTNLKTKKQSKLNTKIITRKTKTLTPENII
jgi:hypothetical protein